MDKDATFRHLQDDKNDKDNEKDDKEDKNATPSPTEVPTTQPSRSPTRTPSASPTNKPTRSPTTRPTRLPTRSPTQTPTRLPTELPTISPVEEVTALPTSSPVEEEVPATPMPSAYPTLRPTLPPVTSLPTAPPTTAEQQVSSTADPTSGPTTELEAKLVGDMPLQVSVFNEDVQLSEADVILSTGIMASIQEVLCNSTDLEIYDSITTTDVNICDGAEASRRQLGVVTGDRSGILKTPFIVVSEGAVQDVEYTSWTLRYSVVDIDQRFIETAEDAFNTEPALLRLRVSTQLALDKAIESGELQEVVDEQYPGTRLSMPGNEVSSFNDINGDAVGVVIIDNSSWLKPNMLRFAGGALLLFQLCISTCLCRIAKRRRRIRIDDAERKEEMDGGLQTTEGVEKILASAHKLRGSRQSSSFAMNGRASAVRVGGTTDESEEDDDDSAPKFALPSSYAVNGRR